MDIHKIIQSQYHASLEMLSRILNNCPEELWNREADINKFWHLAYHAIFYTHLYLSPTEADFKAWEKHRENYYSLETQTEAPDEKPEISQPYSKAEILEYFEHLRVQIDDIISATDLHAESGFYWLPFSKLELQFYNIRHLMQHIGELGERLGFTAQIDTDWVGKRPESD